MFSIDIHSGFFSSPRSLFDSLNLTRCSPLALSMLYSLDGFSSLTHSQSSKSPVFDESLGRAQVSPHPVCFSCAGMKKLSNLKIRRPFRVPWPRDRPRLSKPKKIDFFSLLSLCTLQNFFRNSLVVFLFYLLFGSEASYFHISKFGVRDFLIDPSMSGILTEE